MCAMGISLPTVLFLLNAVLFVSDLLAVFLIPCLSWPLFSLSKECTPLPITFLNLPVLPSTTSVRLVRSMEPMSEAMKRKGGPDGNGDNRSYKKSKVCVGLHLTSSFIFAFVLLNLAAVRHVCLTELLSTIGSAD